MAFKVSTLEIRQKLGDILNRVALRHDEFIIERKGKPLAAVVPVEKIEQMRKTARLHLLDILVRQTPTALSDEKAMSLANQAKKKTRSSKEKKAKRA